MSFIGVIVALAVVGFLLAVSVWVLYYHYRNRRLGLTNQPFLPPLPAFLRRRGAGTGTTGRGVDLENGGRPYEGIGGDDAWDAREEYEGARLHTGPAARGFDGQDERRYDADDDLENPFGEGAVRSDLKGGENPFGSGARRADADAESGDVGKAPSGRKGMFNEEI